MKSPVTGQLLDGQRSAMALRFVATTLFFLVAVVTLFGPAWRLGISEYIPTIRQMADNSVVISDHRVTVARVARNAHALATKPRELFQDEQCAPAKDALASGDPMITFSLLGLPAYVLSRDPVATYNVALLVCTLLGALAMYVVVTDWTGVPAAGLIAGLMHAFNRPKITDVVHPFAWDTTWTVLALWFAQRLFARGRWRDGVGLGMACALQLAESFYPFLAAAFVALPFVVWLLLHYGVRHLRLGPVLVATGITLLAGYWVFTPYLEVLGPGHRVVMQYFIPWSFLLPGQIAGWACFVLAAAALVWPRRRLALRLRADPRWALLVGALLSAIMATNGNAAARLATLASGPPPPLRLPEFYTALAAVIPGLGSIRAAGGVALGVQLTLALLAGIGSAQLAQLASRGFARPLALLLVAVVAVEMLSPHILGATAASTFAPLRIRPSNDALEFFADLQARGNSGPLLELPIASKKRWYSIDLASSQALLSTHHHRRTSGCYMSVIPPVVAEVESLSTRLPAPDAVRSVRALGFTTIILHHPSTRPEEVLRREFDRAAGADGLLRLIHGTPSMTAYEIVS